MKEKQVKPMWGLTIGLFIAAVAVGLLVCGKLDNEGFGYLLLFGSLAGLAVGFYDKIWKLKWGLTGGELETFQEGVDEITKKKLAEMEKAFVTHKSEIEQELIAQSRDLTRIVEMAVSTREDLLKVAEESAPPLLSFASKEIRNTKEGCLLAIELHPSKNAPFATVTFVAEILGDSQAIIMEFRPSGLEMSIHQTQSSDGKKFTIQYVPLGSQNQYLNLFVSAPCKVQMSCSHMRETLEFDIK